VPSDIGNLRNMPRTDRVTLTAKGLTMPSVDHLSNKSSLNVLLDRALSGQLAGVPRDMTLIGLFTNFARLTDKALREYDAARAELLLYLEPSEGLRTSPYLRAIDHMENCIGAAHRAVLNATALRENGVGRGRPAADCPAGRETPQRTPRGGARRREAARQAEVQEEPPVLEVRAVFATTRQHISGDWQLLPELSRPGHCDDQSACSDRTHPRSTDRRAGAELSECNAANHPPRRSAANSGDDATFELPQGAQPLDRYSLTNPGRPRANSRC
jgi:hypothetical protein